MGCFEGHGLLKPSQQPGQSDEIPRESSVSRLMSGQKVAILSDIIINKNLKLFLINYLTQKVDVLFQFPSRSQNPFNRTFGKTIYIYVSKSLCIQYLICIVENPHIL